VLASEDTTDDSVSGGPDGMDVGERVAAKEAVPVRDASVADSAAVLVGENVDAYELDGVGEDEATRETDAEKEGEGEVRDDAESRVEMLPLEERVPTTLDDTEEINERVARPLAVTPEDEGHSDEEIDRELVREGWEAEPLAE
jgi:hypothetical protein